MKYFKRGNIYKASNVSFNCNTNIAYSYDWWIFVKPINGKMVFNNYTYSNSTNKHQSKVRSLLNQLGIKIDYCLECPKGLQELVSGIEYYEYKIKQLEKAINKPRSRKATNVNRMNMINTYKDKIALIEKLRGMEGILYDTFRV